MKMGNKSVLGIYKTRSSAERAIETLKDSGFRTADISVLMPEGSMADDLATIKNTKAPEGATTGAGAGIVFGGTLGWLVGAGLLAVTGLAGLGIPEYEAKRFEGRVKDGGILLSVHVDDSNWAKKARELLEQTGAEDISSSTEVPSEPRNPKKSEVDKTIYNS